MSKIVIKEYKGNIPCNIGDLIKLPGIGEYIASSVVCFAFNKDVPIIDVNVRRVLGRAFSWGKNKDSELNSHLIKMLPKGKSKEFNWGIIDFSSLICSRKPKCKKCFFAEHCFYLNEKNPDD